MNDYISREAAIADSFTVQTREYGSVEVVSVENLASLPSADVVERKTGKWIEHKHEEAVKVMYFSDYECEVCHAWIPFKSPYCPNCGAEMEGGIK